MPFLGRCLKRTAFLVVAVGIVVQLLALGVVKQTGLFHFLVKQKPDLAGGIPAFFFDDIAKWSPRNLPDLTGQIALVTGASKGLGFSTARYLAERGAKVILACRDLAACQAVEAKSRGRGVARKVDLTSLRSVQSFGQSVLAEFERLDMLVLNAGMHPTEFNLTEDGLELSFAVNHVANQLLFKTLRPLLVATATKFGHANVVMVSSRSHYSSVGGVPVTLAEINDRDKFQFRQGYAQSKFASILFAQEVAEQFKRENISVFVNSCHPGLVSTDIVEGTAKTVASVWFKDAPVVLSVVERLLGWVCDYLGRNVMWSPEQGALTQTWLAAAPEATLQGLANTGRYYHPIMQVVEPHPLAKQPLRGQLWSFTDDILRERGFSNSVGPVNPVS